VVIIGMPSEIWSEELKNAAGADGGTRTHGLRITSAPLYR
jgi:hypothetical protein